SHIPPPPADFDLAAYLPPELTGPGGPCSRVTLRPVKLLMPSLSPGQLLVDALGLPEVGVVSRAAGDTTLREARQVASDGGADEPPTPPPVGWTLVGHFLAAALARLFGRGFGDDLRRAAAAGARIAFGGRKLLGFAEGHSRKPVLG